MGILSKEEILKMDDLETVDVVVPEWGGGIVRLRTMTGTARDEYEQYITSTRSADKNETLKNIRETLLLYTVVDESGELMFTKEDICALGKKSIKALDRLFDEAAKINSLRSSDVDDLVGNSNADPSGDSTSS